MWLFENNVVRGQLTLLELFIYCFLYATLVANSICTLVSRPGGRGDSILSLNFTSGLGIFGRVGGRRGPRMGGAARGAGPRRAASSGGGASTSSGPISTRTMGKGIVRGCVSPCATPLSCGKICVGGDANLSVSVGGVVKRGMGLGVGGGSRPRILVVRARAARAFLRDSDGACNIGRSSHAASGGGGVTVINTVVTGGLGSTKVGALRSGARRSCPGCDNDCDEDTTAMGDCLGGCGDVGVILSLRHSSIAMANGSGTGLIAGVSNGGTTRMVLMVKDRDKDIGGRPG